MRCGPNDFLFPNLETSDKSSHNLFFLVLRNNTVAAPEQILHLHDLVVHYSTVANSTGRTKGSGERG
jgi:hypothetical protein